MQLIDFDVVDHTKVTTPGYWARDVGHTKVRATRDAVRCLDPSVDVVAVEDRFRPGIDVGETVFCCVDSITARAAIWRSVSGRCDFWTDGRMLGETIRVLAVAGAENWQHYVSTLFAQNEAIAGRCTTRSTIYAASISAGWMVHQFARWLRSQPVDVDVMINLTASTFVVDESCSASTQTAVV
jgi:molybdopterin-synthase adenylyltransferase